jgi:hypothetical protein
MPMWMSWENPRTGKPERIYNYYDPGDPAGRLAIRTARKALGLKFDMDPESIPGFRVVPASGERPPLFQETEEGTRVSVLLGSSD